jgi:hypothetical protein
VRQVPFRDPFARVVQISALRRALDDGRDGGSLIQTVPGRGYRFTAPVVGDDPAEAGRTVADAPATAGAGSLPDARGPSLQSAAAASPPPAVSRTGSGRRRLYGAGVVALLCAALVGFAWQGLRPDPPTRRAEPPRLSIVVLPFANAGGGPKDEELSAALTDDFTTDLAQMRGASVVARSMAQAMAARKLPSTVEERAREVDGLVIAGLLDHAAEDADPGLPMTEGIRSANLVGRTTPIGAPGVSTIRTAELRALIGDGEGSTGERPPLLLSTDCSDCLDIAIPGTNFIPDAYRSGVLDDAKRQALKLLVDRLLRGDQTRRVITFAWNAGWWNSRNLAIELVALGYPNVSWYRGGLEAWDVAGLPVTRLK